MPLLILRFFNEKINCDNCLFQLPRTVKDGRLKWGPFCGLPAYLGEGDPVECETAKHGCKLRKKAEPLAPPF